MDATIALVRHGEVHNPDHVVYADLDGYGLSDLGWSQADAAAARLAKQGVTRIVTSPLQRAVETSHAIAARCGLAPLIDPRLSEWGLGVRWAGIVWEDLPTVHPGELEAYLEHPLDLPFSPESLQEVAIRVKAAIASHTAGATGCVVFVSHQDPVQASRIALAGRDLATLHENKPGHGSIASLRSPGTDAWWIEDDYWQPDQGDGFPPVERTAAPAP